MGYDKEKESRACFDKDGGIAVEDPNIIYETCEIIFLWLPDTGRVRRSIEDILATGREGLTIINMSPEAPANLQELKRRTEERRISLLESPLPRNLQGENREALGATQSEVEAYRNLRDFMEAVSAQITSRVL